MIILDTETTGLLGPTALPLDQQPQIIEFAATQLKETKGGGLKVGKSLHLLLNPGVPLSDEIIKITGLTDDDLKDAPSFAVVYQSIVDFFIGEEIMVAHNLPFDRGMLAGELQRIDKLLAFPWPPKHICTAEATEHLSEDGKYMKQEALYKLATGRDANQTHRANDDVAQLVEIVRWMRGEYLI